MTTKSSDNGHKEGYKPNLALLGHVNYKKKNSLFKCYKSIINEYKVAFTKYKLRVKRQKDDY